MQMPFQWGPAGQKLTPSQAKAMRDVASALAARKGTPQNVGEGLASVGDALLYNSNMARAGEAESAGMSQVAQALAEARASGGSDGFLDVMGNEWASPAQQLVAGELYKRSIPDYQTFESGGDILRWNQNDPESQPSVFYDGPEAPRKPPQVETRYNPETGMDEKVQWDETAGDWAPFGGQKAPSGPLVTVTTGEGADGELNKALSKAEGDAWAGYKTAAAVSSSNAQDFGVLKELMTISPQGPIVGPLAEAFKGFNSAGDAFQSIVKRIAPTLRAPGSGATSDIEYDGMLQSLPSLKNAPEGNTMILSIMEAKAQINMERGRIVTAYQNGEMDIREARIAMDELNSRSIMTPEMRRALDGIGATGTPDDKDAPKVGEVVDGYEYLGGNPASPTSWKKR
jgi:hypothetical protein